jgi:hypothetical protein
MVHAMTVPTSFRRGLVAAVVLASVAATPAQAGAASKLKLGVYDCMRYDYGSGFLLFSSTIKLKAGRKYEHAFGRKGAKLTDKSSGTYRVRGNKITFKGGGMSKAPGQIEEGTGSRKEPFINLLYEGRPSGISCYYVAKP